MSFLKTLNPSAFGIDLSDRSIKIIQFKKKGEKLSNFLYGNEEIPAGLIEDGEIKDFKKIAELIKKIKSKTKPASIKTDYAVCSLPESKCFFREIDFPEMTLEEVSEAIKWETEQQIPLSWEEIYLDWHVLNEKKSLKKIEEKSTKDNLINSKKESNLVNAEEIKKKTKVFLTAAPRKLVDSYVEVLKQAGLKPIAMEIESAAIVRTLVNKNKNKYDSAVLIIDFGETRTNFIIFKPPLIRFSRSISFSGAFLTNKISKELKIKYSEAEKLKRKWGMDEEKGGGALAKCIEPALVDLSEKIQKSLNYYSEHFSKNFPENEVKKIILCGGGANLKGLDSWLASKIKKEVEKNDPWSNVSSLFLNKKLSFPKDSCYATAIGLALRGAT
jgi:type IV pilus assembly protein PilM